MNYIEQELSRQKTLLTAILGGGGVKSAAEDDFGGDISAETEMKTPQEVDGGQTRTGAEKNGEAQPGAAASSLAEGREETKPTASFRAQPPLSGTEIAARKRAAFSSEEYAGETAALAAAFPVSQTASSLTAREISRAVERDARRYDGSLT